MIKYQKTIIKIILWIVGLSIIPSMMTYREITNVETSLTITTIIKLFVEKFSFFISMLFLAYILIIIIGVIILRIIMFFDDDVPGEQQIPIRRKPITRKSSYRTVNNQTEETIPTNPHTQNTLLQASTPIQNPPSIYIHPLQRKYKSQSSILTVFLTTLVLTPFIILIYSNSKTWNSSQNQNNQSIVSDNDTDSTNKSIARVFFSGSRGRNITEVGGVVVSDNEIVVKLWALAGASSGYVVIPNRSQSYPITGVIAVDREKDIAIIKILDGKGIPINIKSNMISIAQEINITAETGATISDISKLLDRRGTVEPLATVGANRVLMDFRNESEIDFEYEGELNLSDEENDFVISSVFPHHLESSEHCPQPDDDFKDDHLAEARRTGYIVPKITDVAYGAFTNPGVQQTAYIIHVGECNASHGEDFGTSRLVIFTNERLVANYDVSGYSNIATTNDIDNDGLTELLIAGSSMNQGYFVAVGKYVTVRNRKMRIIKDFDAIIDDNCGSVKPNSSKTVAVIMYSNVTKDEIPIFRVDNYRAQCSKNISPIDFKSFKIVSSGKMPNSE